MRKMRTLKVGKLCQIPLYEQFPYRKGWNGWKFAVGVIDKIYTTKSGRKAVTVRYCSKCASRYQLLPCTEVTKNVYAEFVFEWDFLDLYQRNYNEYRQVEENGEQVC